MQTLGPLNCVFVEKIIVKLFLFFTFSKIRTHCKLTVDINLISGIVKVLVRRKNTHWIKIRIMSNIRIRRQLVLREILKGEEVNKELLSSPWQDA